MTEIHPSRRSLIKGAGGLGAALALGGAGVVAAAGTANAATVADGFGLRLIDHNEDHPRLKYYRVKTAEIGWPTGPGINVLLPDGYATSGLRYPVLYLFHGGGPGLDFTQWDWIVPYTAGLPMIIVMPDGGQVGWHSNPVSSFVGPRNWESFHMNQLVPWIDANFRTHAEFAGRAVCGFSMGGFGALKYGAKYYGHFASVSSHSGPASMRRNFGAAGHWANATSAAIDLAGGTIYGVPFWDQARVSADNAVENVERYRGKRVYLVAGNGTQDILADFKGFTENQVLQGHQEFSALLTHAGIPHQQFSEQGGHVIRFQRIMTDFQEIVAHLRPAS
ncbi:alpha/beta hydrolase [Yinghuangia soli]|uniref:Acyl-CoA:diacylglycerol acyltransferase n=1 Tax=Yinghuangia soli TaxID=2908204 RepID=A0AA41TZP7_9ACTN|nr:alpha/beta hydrolase-fold protein [Yinghuangia soli]MCF2527520.1 esterase family protein [Yinghuangia soli]